MWTTGPNDHHNSVSPQQYFPDGRLRIGTAISVPEIPRQESSLLKGLVEPREVIACGLLPFRRIYVCPFFGVQWDPSGLRALKLGLFPQKQKIRLTGHRFVVLSGAYSPKQTCVKYSTDRSGCRNSPKELELCKKDGTMRYYPPRSRAWAAGIHLNPSSCPKYSLGAVIIRKDFWAPRKKASKSGEGRYPPAGYFLRHTESTR